MIVGLRAGLAAALALVIACTSAEPAPASPPSAASAAPTSPPAVPTIASRTSLSPSPTGTAVPVALDARFGFLMAAASSLYVRGEVRPDPVSRVPGRFTYPRLSPDGKTVAYWEGDAAGLHVLRTLALASPANAKTVYETADGSGDGAVWSSDGTGLLFGVVSTDRSQLLAVDLADGKAMELAANTGPAGVFGRSDAFVPLAWDRQRRLALAFEGGEGGFAYRYVAVQEDGRIQRWQHSTDTVRYTSIEASPDARWAWSVSLDEPKVMRVWSGEDYARSIELKAAGADSIGAASAPNGALGVVQARAFQLLDPASGALHSIHASSDYIAATPILFRADGSAVLLQVRAATGVRYEVVDLRTGDVGVVATGSQDAFVASLRLSP